MFPRDGFGYVFGVILVALVVNQLYAVVQKHIQQQLGFATVQLLIDCLTVVSLVYFTGGVHSTFINLYFGIILAAGVLLRPNDAILFASVATVLQASVSLGYYFSATSGGSLPGVAITWLEPVQREFSYTMGYLVAQVSAFHLVALLARWLSLRLSQERILYEEILHNLSEGVVTLDRHGKLVFLNPRARHLLGIKYDADVERQELIEVIPEANRGPIKPLLEDAESRIETLLVTNYSDIVPAEINTSLLLDEKGRVRGVVGILVDLSLRRKMEEAIKRADRLQVVSELSASIAHEIRNPLASIRGCVQELGREPSLPDDAREMMSIVLDESDRLDGIITEFLQFARMPKAVHRPVKLNRLLSEVTLLLQKNEQGGERVKLEAQPDLALSADPQQLRQLLFNLGLNAIQASGDDQPVLLRARLDPLLLAVRFDEKTGDERRDEIEGVRIEVVDRGQGIDPEVADRLFDPFVTTKTRGTGMGLAIVNRIVEAHHGSIDVSSTPGENTTFSVWFPVNPEEVAGLRLSGIDHEEA